jgi:hypothetical protein
MSDFYEVPDMEAATGELTTADVPAPGIDLAFMVRDAVQRHSMNSARTKQSAARLIGPSEIGGCRAYLARVIADVPFDDMSHDVKWAAFIGTAVGAHIEAAMAAEYPDEVITQVPIEATFPSGLKIAGNADIVRRNIGVVDIKSVDGLETVRRAGPSFKQLAQIMTYLLGLIQGGHLPPDATWSLVFVDRSGRDDTPVVYEGTLNMDVIEMIDARLEDVMYAVEYDLDSAPRDEPFDWCMKVCPMFTKCRGKDEHIVTGLITNEDVVTAAKLYAEGQQLKKTGERLMDETKQILRGVKGSTGEVEISWTSVPETTIQTYVRAGYDRLTLKPVKKPAAKKPSSRAKKAS